LQVFNVCSLSHTKSLPFNDSICTPRGSDSVVIVTITMLAFLYSFKISLLVWMWGLPCVIWFPFRPRLVAKIFGKKFM
jgi:hypothetical protein